MPEENYWDSHAKEAAVFDKWASDLFKIVVNSVGPAGCGPLGYNAWSDGGDDPMDPESGWWLEVAEQLTEFVGGKDDGVHLYDGFSFAIDRIAKEFQPSDITGTVTIEYSSQPHENHGTPAVSIEGIFQGRYTILVLHGGPTKDSRVTKRVNARGEFWAVDPEGDDDDEDDDSWLDEIDN